MNESSCNCSWGVRWHKYTPVNGQIIHNNVLVQYIGVVAMNVYALSWLRLPRAIRRVAFPRLEISNLCPIVTTSRAGQAVRLLPPIFINTPLSDKIFRCEAGFWGNRTEVPAHDTFNLSILEGRPGSLATNTHGHCLPEHGIGGEVICHISIRTRVRVELNNRCLVSCCLCYT